MSKKEQRYMFPFSMKRANVRGENGAVSSNSYYATKAGLEILKKGGNAIDAAVATSLTLSVVEPHHSGIGGGCFVIMYIKELDEVFTIDARGIAPLYATETMFQDEWGNVQDEWVNYTAKSTAIPGMYMALDRMLRDFGTMSLREVSEHAIGLANNGFLTSFALEYTLKSKLVQNKIAKSEEFKKLYTKEDGKLYGFGETMKNEDLAKTMSYVANKGISSFYNGKIAKRIIAAINENNGIYVEEDLSKYEVSYGKPIKGTYRDYDVLAIGPPSSGGAHIIQMLNILENENLGKLGHNTGEYIHIVTETMKIAFADRSIAMGDPRFVDLKLDKIISKDYGRLKYNEIDKNKAQHFSPNMDLEPKHYPGSTSHFSIIDKYGNVVSQTQTIRDWFGCGVVPKDLGFVLNNTMADFSAKTGVKTSQGLVYGKANSIQPKKTPLSSMSPIIIFKDGNPYLAIGAAGGPRIITSTLQGILNIIDFNMDPDEAIRAPFIHAMTMEQGLELEPGISKDSVDILKEKGHTVFQSNKGEVLTFMLNSVMKKADLLYPSTTMRVDGVGGVLTKDNDMILDGMVFKQGGWQ